MYERYKQLLFSSTILFSSYFCYDIPAALNKNIHLGDSKFSSFEITTLYSAYALPNIFVPLIFVFFKNFSRKNFNVFLSFLVFTGHLIFTIGIWKKTFLVMVLGRLVFGIGNETLFVIQSKLISTNFKGKELSFALATFTSLGRLGIVINFLITPLLARKFNNTLLSIVGLVLILISVMLNTLRKRSRLREVAANKPMYIKIFHEDISTRPNDKTEVHIPNIDICENEKPKFINDNCFFEDERNVWRREEVMESKPMKMPCRTGTFRYCLGNNGSREEYSKQCFNCDDCSDKSHLETKNNENRSLTKEEGIHSRDRNGNDKNGNDKNGKDRNSNDRSPTKEEGIHSKDRISKGENIYFKRPQKISFEKINPTDLIHAPLPKNSPKTINQNFYLLVLIAFLLAFIWAPFYNLGPLLFQKRYHYTIELSASIMGFLEIIQMFTIIVIGIISDLTGIKLLFIALGSLLLVLSHVLIFINYNLLVVILILGFAGPLHSCYWSCVVYLAPQEYLAVAFSVISSSLNLSFTLSPLIASYLLQINHNFDYLEVFSIILGAFTVCMVVVLNIIDFKKKLGMNKREMT